MELQYEVKYNTWNIYIQLYSAELKQWLFTDTDTTATTTTVFIVTYLITSSMLPPAECRAEGCVKHSAGAWSGADQQKQLQI